MIVDSLNNASIYSGIHSRFHSAFEELQSIDWSSLEYGRYAIDGDEIFMMWGEHELKEEEEDAKLEAHNSYIDIQLVVEGVESFGWSDRSACLSKVAEFDTDRDIQFFNDEPTTYVTLKAGEFTIFMPTDAHAPLVGSGSVKKCVVKIKI